MTIDEIIKHCDDYITSMNKYADTGNIGWWLEFYHTVLSGFRELKALKAQQPTLDTRQRERQLEMEYQKGYDKGWEEGRKALEQQPSEDTEVIKVSKGAVKSRQGRFVIYDVEWLKENFYSTEEKIYGQPKQPSEDCVSREQALLALTGMDLPTDRDKLIALFTKRIQHLPPVTPQRSKGKWTMNSDYPDRLICEKCKAQFDMWHWESKQMHYCPNCGVEMNGGGEDDLKA